MNERADEQMAQYSLRQFHGHSTRCGLAEPQEQSPLSHQLADVFIDQLMNSLSENLIASLE